MRNERAIWPVILSGGAGSRLWPLSRAALPKQLLPLAGAQTMIQATAARAADRQRFHAPVVVAGAEHGELIAAGLAAAGNPAAAIIAEPFGRNTAPAIALAAAHIAADDPQALMLVMPSDHVIADLAAFARAVEHAAPLAADGWLVTFGITPTGPETGYGYIHFGEPLDDGARQVQRFVEKPDLATARAYVESGDYAWNAGIFLFSASRVMASLAEHAPGIAASAARAIERAARRDIHIEPDAEAFGESPSDSIDYAVMEKDARVAVVPVDMGWSDVGSWSSLKEISAPDDSGNVIAGDVIAIDTRHSLLRSEGPLLAAIGIADLAIVATDDAVLVATLDRAQDVKKIVDTLGRRSRREHLDAPRIAHAWGAERTLSRSDAVVVTELTVAPGEALPTRYGQQLTLSDGALEADGVPLVAGEPLTTEGGYRLANPSDAVARAIELRFPR